MGWTLVRVDTDGEVAAGFAATGPLVGRTVDGADRTPIVKKAVAHARSPAVVPIPPVRDKSCRMFPGLGTATVRMVAATKYEAAARKSGPDTRCSMRSARIAQIPGGSHASTILVNGLMPYSSKAIA